MLQKWFLHQNGVEFNAHITYGRFAYCLNSVLNVKSLVGAFNKERSPGWRGCSPPTSATTRCPRPGPCRGTRTRRPPLPGSTRWRLSYPSVRGGQHGGQHRVHGQLLHPAEEEAQDDPRGHGQRHHRNGGRGQGRSSSASSRVLLNVSDSVY